MSAVYKPTHELKITVADRYMTYGAATGVGECLLLEAIKLVSSERKEKWVSPDSALELPLSHSARFMGKQRRSHVYDL